MISLDERGKQCPIPIVDTKKAVEPLGVGEVVETVVDNEISAQNLKKFADQRQYAYEMEKVSNTEYRVRLTVTEAAKELQDKGTATFNEQDYQACGIPAAAPQGYIVWESRRRSSERFCSRGSSLRCRRRRMCRRRSSFTTAGHD